MFVFFLISRFYFIFEQATSINPSAEAEAETEAEANISSSGFILFYLCTTSYEFDFEVVIREI